jgi:flagellar hook-associated protein 3 FlgL
MSLTSIGDLANIFVLRHQNAATKAQLQVLSQELTFGRAEDTAAHLSGNLAPLAGIETSLATLAAYRSVAQGLQITGGAMQAALGVIDQNATDLSRVLLTAATASTVEGLSAVAEEAVQRLDAAMGALNTRFGDRSIFAGTTPDQPAVIDAEALLDLLEPVVAGALSAADAMTALEAWFDDPGGFATQAYLGGDAAGAVGIAPGETAALDVTAADPAILDTLRALALPALMSRGLFDGQTPARAELAQLAGEALLEGQSGRALLAARLGTIEGKLANAQARNAAEITALEVARSQMIGLDGYDTATRLQAAQAQLETLYTLTARLQGLSLVHYL